MGISPLEFRKCRMSDIKDIMEVTNAWDQKTKREEAIAKAMSELH